MTDNERHDAEHFARLGRANKAHKLARLCRQNGWDHNDAARWTDEQWETAAAMAEVNPPSEKTRGMVIGFLTPNPNGDRTHG